jgi:signal transduction histidine kinase
MSSHWLKRYESADALTRLEAWLWWLRAAVFVAAAVIVLTSKGAIAVGIAELSIAAAALAGWWASDRLPAPWSQRTLLGCLAVLAAVGGFAATSHQQTSVLVVAIVAMLAAGEELPPAGLAVVFLVGVLAVEIGAVRYGDADLATVLGYPALLAGLALAGRYRRAYRTQSEQAEALLAETRRAQFEAERAATLTERSRIAREIHDVLAHSLSALGVQLQATEVLLADHHDIDRALQAIASARRLVDEGLTETQRAVRALRTDTPPLPQALTALVEDRPGALTVSGQPHALSPAAGLALLRVAQEALANAAKHGGAEPPTLTLEYADASVELRVENALPVGRVNDRPSTIGGYGLAGMHERLRLIGGQLHAGPVGDRWVVQARVTG